jgi:hypothetical protein
MKENPELHLLQSPQNCSAKGASVNFDPIHQQRRAYASNLCFSIIWTELKMEKK